MYSVLILWVAVFLLLPSIHSAVFPADGRNAARGRIFSIPRRLPKAMLMGNLTINMNVHQLAIPANSTEITILEPRPPSTMRSVVSIISLSIMFASWYILSAGPSLQLLLGSLVCSLPLYLLRLKSFPSLGRGDLAPLLPIALCNTIGHIAALKAVFQVSGSLAHVIKSAEPVVQVLCLWLWNGVTPRPLTALSLVPISYGVAYASTLGDLNLDRLKREMSSQVASLAMLSNVAFAMRSIFKRNLNKDYKKRTGLTPSNEHALTTLLSFLFSLPLVLYFEPLSVSWSRLNSSGSSTFLYKDMLVTSVCFYLYNSLQNTLLSRLDPVSTAVGSAVKRVAILVGLYMYTPGEFSSFPPSRVVGCGVAVAGCLLYAIFDALKM